MTCHGGRTGNGESRALCGLEPAGRGPQSEICWVKEERNQFSQSQGRVPERGWGWEQLPAASRAGVGGTRRGKGSPGGLRRRRDLGSTSWKAISTGFFLIGTTGHKNDVRDCFLNRSWWPEPFQMRRSRSPRRRVSSGVWSTPHFTCLSPWLGESPFHPENQTHCFRSQTVIIKKFRANFQNVRENIP